MNFPDRSTDHLSPQSLASSAAASQVGLQEVWAVLEEAREIGWGLEDRDQEALGNGSKKDEMAEVEVREGLGLSPEELKAGT